MLKKMMIIMAAMIVFLLLNLPSRGISNNVVLDQQIEPLVPGNFQLMDLNRDRKAGAIKFLIRVQAYREGNFIVTGNLEGEKNGAWLAIATSVISFPWTPGNNKIELIFPTSNIIKYQISGPYRVVMTFRSGDWELPAQIVGFSPKYAWNDFGETERINFGIITTESKAEKAAETWAEYKTIKLNGLKEISFNYDHWQVDFWGETGEIWRFLVSPGGSVEMQRIIRNSGLHSVDKRGTDLIKY